MDKFISDKMMPAFSIAKKKKQLLPDALMVIPEVLFTGCFPVKRRRIFRLPGNDHIRV